MDDQIDFAVALLKLVTKELQNLTAEQKTEVLDGNAKLKLIVESKGVKRTEKSAETPIDIDALREQLENCKTRDDAKGILKSLSVSKTSLQKLTRQLELPVQRDDDIERLVVRIVESVVGFRLRSQAIQGKSDITPLIAEQSVPPENAV